MRLGPPDFDETDRALAAQFQATLTKEDIAASYRLHGVPIEAGKVLCDVIVPLDAAGAGSGSTDVGDVSWVVPTVQLWGATCAIGTPFHAWQFTGQGKSGMAHKGLVHAAKVMAGTAVDALEDETLIRRAQEDLRRRLEAEPYMCPLPPDLDPPIEVSEAA
jgi:aminobenzoyl-glutamate utilization protein B